MENKIDQTIRGYELRKELGRGGFGAVYLAYQPQLHREVAIKVILPQYANLPDFIRKFEVEAELVARLEHPHIVPLFDYWRDPDGAYLILRYLRGGNLKDLIDRGAVPLDRTTRLVEQIASALHVAHRNRVVHRDIKPENIMLDEDDNAYLTDFGIAHSPEYHGDAEDEGVSGSIPYTPPEQLQSRSITPQADIYALGIVVFEMLTGQHPFEGLSTTDMIFKHLQDPLPDIYDFMDELPPEANEIIQTATQKDPGERYQDIREIPKALRALLDGELIVTDKIIEDVFIPNPYKGLRAFQEADAEDFFGRSGLVDHLLEQISGTEAAARFLAVIGPSGSGKSSVVKAGLIPALRQDRLPGSSEWFITEMYPGSHPFVELEAALLRIAVNPPETLINQLREPNGLLRAAKRILPNEASQLVLVIDQFEELFTTVSDENLRKQFLAGLVGAITDSRSPLRIIITMRADFYDRPLQYHTFGNLLRKRVETVLPLTREELAESITEPASQVGVTLQTGLADAIIADIGEQPGTLPLLQYALTELFERRAGRVLTLEAYQSIGGVVGALARRAEDLYIEQDEALQAAIRQLFLRLVALGEGSENTRRRVRQSELPAVEGIETVLDRYGRARLLTFDRDPETRVPTIEIAHEALIRSWQRLNEWIALDKDALQIHQRLMNATKDWLASGQDESFLATGTRLEQFQNWMGYADLALSQDEDTYLKRSIHHREEKRRIEEARKAEEARIARRAQTFQRASWTLGVMVTFAIIAIAFATVQNLQVRAERALFVAQQDRVEVLAEGGAIIGLDDLQPEGDVFYATATANAILLDTDPVFQAFNCDQGYCVEMALVPPGCFWMGSLVEADEQPTHEICFEDSFWIDRYEVSNIQFERLGGQAESPPDWPESDQPRTSVTWREARDFCELRGAALPSEAEWEYAARGPESLVFPWGNQFVPENAVYFDTANAAPGLVGSRPGGISWVGALDLSGNVWEWTSTLYEQEAFPYPYTADDGRENLDADAGNRVLRSGSFIVSDFGLRATNRYSVAPTDKNFNNGFRCVRHDSQGE